MPMHIILCGNCLLQEDERNWDKFWNWDDRVPIPSTRYGKHQRGCSLRVFMSSLSFGQLEWGCASFSIFVWSFELALVLTASRDSCAIPLFGLRGFCVEVVVCYVWSCDSKLIKRHVCWGVIVSCIVFSNMCIHLRH